MSAPVLPLRLLLAAATVALLALPVCCALYAAPLHFRSPAQAQSDFLLPSETVGRSSSEDVEGDAMLMPIDITALDQATRRLQPYLAADRFIASLRDPLSPQSPSVDLNDLESTSKRSNPVGKRIKQLNKNAREQFYRLMQQQPSGGGGGGSSAASSGSWQQSRDFKRERTGSGSSLSVDSSLDLIRQRFLQELRRKQTAEKQKQINSNREMMSDIGKRDTQRSATYRDGAEATLAPPLGGSL